MTRMRPFNIQGAHGAWQMAANMNRPTDGAALLAEIRRLHTAGLSTHVIAHRLCISVKSVLDALV